MDRMSVQHYLPKESLTTMPAIIFVHQIAKYRQDADVSKHIFLQISKSSQHKVEVSREDSKSVYASTQSDESLFLCMDPWLYIEDSDQTAWMRILIDQVIYWGTCQLVPFCCFHTKCVFN